MSDDAPATEDFEDFKEKRKLLARWKIYFPHEPEKDFDVHLLFEPFPFSAQ